MNWYRLSQSVNIGSIDGSDLEQIDQLILAGFPQYASWAVQYSHAASDWSLSKKATIDDQIVGCYLIGRRTILEGVRDEKMTPTENLQPYQNKHGVEGVALITSPQFRSQGIASSLKGSIGGVDYIWGLQLKGLNNLQYWLTRRRLVAESPTCYATLQDI